MTNLVCFGEKIEGAKITNPKELSWALVPVKIFSVPYKLIMVEEDTQDQHCLFRRGDDRNKRRNNEEHVLGSSSGDAVFLYIENCLR
jgi:hypothetical protein